MVGVSLSRLCETWICHQNSKLPCIWMLLGSRCEVNGALSPCQFINNDEKIWEGVMAVMDKVDIV